MTGGGSTRGPRPDDDPGDAGGAGRVDPSGDRADDGVRAVGDDAAPAGEADERASAPRPIAAIESLADRYALFLFDQYGVLHDGVRPYPGVHETLRALKATGRRIGVITNSGKRAEYNRERLERFGYGASLVDLVASSGEVAWRLLSTRRATLLPELDEGVRARVLVLSRGGDRDFIEGLSLVETDDAGACDLVLIAGCEPWRTTLDAYRERLLPAAARAVPALCTNPDRVQLLADGTRGFAAGVVADAYAALGGPVTRLGKPWPAIYAQALEMAGVPAAETLCIGDSVEHDIAGAAAAGCDSLLVRTGIHADATGTDLEGLFAAENARPDWIVDAAIGRTPR